MGSSAPVAVGRIEHSEQLLAAIRRRVEELQLTHEIIDASIGWSPGYASKCLSNPPSKRLGHFGLFALLEILALDILLVENSERLERLKNSRHLRRRPLVLRSPRIVVLTPDMLRANGAKGARARNLKLSAKRRKALALRAIRARWAKHRRNVRASAAAASQSPPASV
ncbi:MAG: hypothetical protein WAV38_38970 [Xanthobacteraceae bacterium]